MTDSSNRQVSGALPNVLLITTDSQRCDTLACMGNQHAHSPHLDRLAAEGVMFLDAYTACPVCTPARCSLMTGTHTHIHGAIENGIIPHDHLTVFPTLLRDAGYTTIHVGKSHVGPLHPAYDHQCMIVGEKGSDKPDPYTAFLAEHGFRRGAGQAPLPAELHMESFLVDQTIAAIEEARSGSNRPFFAHCSLLSPHDPLDPPSPWDTLYEDRYLYEINYRSGEMAGQPALLHDVFGLGQLSDAFHSPDGELDRPAVDAHRRRYYGLAAFCDDQIGRLIDFMDVSRIREQTLVIFTSDHGMQLFDHGFNNKHCYFDASWRVPLIMSLPGTLPAGEQPGMASWIDIAPSILAAAGITCDTMQGFDLFSPLRDGNPLPRVCAATTLYTSSAVVSDKWKLEWYFGESDGRLYDRHNDPAEQSDLSDSAQHVQIRTSLFDALLRWRAEAMDVEWIKAHTDSSGPVATNVARRTMQLNGTAAELRLNDRIATLEASKVLRKD